MNTSILIRRCRNSTRTFKRSIFQGVKVAVTKLSSDPMEGVNGLSILPQEIEETSVPEDAILVKVSSCAVHWVDLLMFAGQYQQAPPIPYTPGMEYSGTVAHIAKGVKTDLSVGEPVYVGDIFNTGPRSYGAYAAWGGMGTYSMAPSKSVRRIPGSMTFDQAAVLSGAAETAYHGLVHCGGLKKGETALIHGATGASGLTAVQICSAIGANMIVTGGSDEKLKIVEEQCFGSGKIIGKFNYRNEQKLSPFVKSLGVKGVDLIFDTVGGAELSRESLKVIKFGGRYCVIGWTSTPMAGGGRGAGANHATANLIPTNLIMMKGAKVIGCPVAIHTKIDPSIRIPRLKAIDAWVEEGLIKPYVSHVFPFEQYREALMAKWDRQITGNCVLRCDESKEGK